MDARAGAQVSGGWVTYNPPTVCFSFLTCKGYKQVKVCLFRRPAPKGANENLKG